MTEYKTMFIYTFFALFWLSIGCIAGGWKSEGYRAFVDQYAAHTQVMPVVIKK